MSTDKTQLAVIGGGPGGYAAAFMAADLGLQVTLIDPRESPGGVCLYEGCIPSKALLHAAKLVFEARQAQAWGIRFGPPQIDLKMLREWKNGVVAQLTGGVGQLARQKKIEHIRATATFRDSESLHIWPLKGQPFDLTF